MSKRIGLFTPKNSRRKKGDTTTTASYVDVDSVSDLAAKLTQLGAKRVGLLRRDRLGVTHNEGAMFPIADLRPSHLEWVTGKAEEFQTRGLYYETT